MSAAARFARLSWRDRFRLGEAMAFLALAALCIAFLSFPTVAKIAASRRHGRPPASIARAGAIAWAVNACARRVPWRALCFERGLAAQLMLRRRGLQAQLHYGVRRAEEGALAAHVWLTSGDVEVIGCESAADFQLLTVFGGEANAG